MSGEKVTETSFLARTITIYEKKIKNFQWNENIWKKSAKSANLDF